MLIDRRAESGEPELLKHLQFFPPAEQRRELKLALSRSREVPVSWRKIIKHPEANVGERFPYEPSPDSTEPFRAFFAQHWGFADPEAPSQTELDRLVLDYVKREGDRIWRVAIGDRGLSGKGQQYLLLPRNDAVFTDRDFADPPSYAALWKKVDRVQAPVEFKTEMEELDLSPGEIWRQYRELISLRTVAEKVSTQADALVDAVLKNGFLDSDALGGLVSRYLGMKSMRIDVEERLFRLKDQAEDLGYVFNIGPAAIQYKLSDGTVQTLQPGELYQPYLSRITWQTSFTRREVSIRRGWFSSSYSVRNVTYVVNHAQVVTLHKRLIIDFDPWVEKERELSEKGFKSYRFERVGGGYRTAGGVTLEEVLLLCDRDRSFWEKCVVWLPVYDQKLTQGEVLTKYRLITRPMRGVEVVHLPRLFIEEGLSVRTHARVRVEVGELAHTINLGPGEKRTITVERSSTSEREERRSAKSLVDLVDTNTTDFATEFEREARSETEKTNSTSWSVKASGGWGGFSAGAEGGGTSTVTAKDFARRVESIAQKAARSVTRKTQEEITSSSSVRTTTSSSEKNVIEVENINAGRSLNLAFYRLNNVASFGLYADQLEFVVLSGVEVIAGSGIILPEVYPLAELPSALSRLALSAMPVKAAVDVGEARRMYARQLLLDLLAALQEYDVKAPEVRSVRVLAMEEDGSADPESLEKIKTAAQAYKPETDPKGDALLELVKRLESFLATAKIEQQTPLGSVQELVSGSAGFYLDSFVGLRPGTEPYAEEARALELQVRAADAAEGQARAAYFRSITAPVKGVTAKAVGDKQLEVTFVNEPTTGWWRVWVDDADTGGRFEVRDPKKRIYTVTWAAPQPWLSAAQGNVCQLIHETSQIIYAVVI